MEEKSFLASELELPVVLDPEFPGVNQPQGALTYYLTYFFGQKLHENERASFGFEISEDFAAISVAC